METAQLNVRIDADLKAAGDKVLDRFGVSAVQIVRSVWQYMVEHQEVPNLALDEPAISAPEARAIAEQGAGMAMRLAAESGLRTELESMTFAELRESAYEEMVLERSERHA